MDTAAYLDEPRVLWASDTSNKLTSDEKLLVTVVCVAIVTVVGTIVYKIVRSGDRRMDFYANQRRSGYTQAASEDDDLEEFSEEFSENFAGQLQPQDAHFFPQGY
mmetsp:Transcript_12111/g.14643  ORF Transcript_12111/g.14643 Transcript_12111/m.14643 type:complete len:105 (+) Transcript_12111:2-316(+)